MRNQLMLASVFLLAIATTGCQSRTDDMVKLTKIDKQFNAGNLKLAREQLDAYLEEYPESSRGWTLMGWIHLKFDRFEDAQDCFDKSIALDPSWDNAYVGLGVMHRKLGDNNKARKSYEKAISIEPNNAEAYSSLLVIELVEKNDAKAVEYGEKAWSIRKDMASIPANLAIAYHYLGDKKKRDKYFQHAKRLKYHRVETLKQIFDGDISLR